MKKFIFFFVSLLIGFGLLLWVVRFIGWQNIESAFLLFAGWQGLVIVLLTLLMITFGLLKWKIILKSQGYDFSSRKLAGPYLSGFSLAYLFPMVIFGGEIFKGYILKENFSIPWKNGITSVVIDKILEGTFFLITIFAGLIFFLLKIGLPPKNLEIILGGFLFLATSIIGFFYFKIFKKESIVKILAKFFDHKKFLNIEILEAEQEIFTFFKSRPKFLLQASVFAVLRIIVTWLRCWLLILFLGKSIGIFSVLSILGFYYFAFMLPIPMALGSHELIQTFSFTALGVGPGTAPVFTMILRGAELILVFIGLVIFLRLGLRLLQTVLFRKLENLIK
ncbi:MAG: flippase-like domain-containing protein [Candidatus Nealsonbacteria bacterium]|nr:flippase-like domain-containing protein [Candidatus Nealsonbacteria bacterium]